MEDPFDLLIKSRFSEMFSDIKTTIKLGEATDILGGFAFNSKDIKQNGIRLVQISNVNQKDLDWTVSNCVSSLFEKKHYNFTLNEFDIIVALTRPIVQSQSTVKTSIVRKEDLPCILNQRLGRIRCDQKTMNYVFVYYCLKQPRFTRYIDERSTGSSQPNISIKDLNSFEIPFASIQMQNEFAQFVHRVDVLKDTYKEIISKLNVLIKSRFIEMFGNPIVNEKGWDVNSLESITSKIGSGATPSGGKASYVGTEISLVRSMNVHDSYFDYEDLAHITEEQANQLSNAELCKSDVLLNITGASVARCCVLPDDVLPGRVNQHVCIIRPNYEIMNPYFLSYLLISGPVKAFLLNISKSNGATREAITKDMIEKLKVITPPMTLQRSFVDFVQQIDKTKVILLEQITRNLGLYN